MRRRSRASSKLAKARSRKAMPKRRNATTVHAESESARLRRERDEALERENATSLVLRLISKSPGDLKLVFRSILENATRICEAKFGTLLLVEGDCFRRTAHYNTPQAYRELSSREPVLRPGPRTALGRVATTKQFVHITDITAEQVYAERDPLRVMGVELLGIRTLVVVPMLKGNELIGAIAIFRNQFVTRRTGTGVSVDA